MELIYKKSYGGLYSETRMYDIKKGTISNRESERYGELCLIRSAHIARQVFKISLFKKSYL